MILDLIHGSVQWSILTRPHHHVFPSQIHRLKLLAAQHPTNPPLSTRENLWNDESQLVIQIQTEFKLALHTCAKTSDNFILIMLEHVPYLRDYVTFRFKKRGPISQISWFYFHFSVNVIRQPPLPKKTYPPDQTQLSPSSSSNTKKDGQYNISNKCNQSSLPTKTRLNVKRLG